MPPAARIFVCYAREDEELRARLLAHLSVLERSGVISTWHDDKIAAGESWEAAVQKELSRADIILLLISASFLQSDYCYDVEMARALRRHENGEAIVIPILLRPVDWQGAPFAHLQCLPNNELAVTLWRNLDEALADVGKGIREAVAARASGEKLDLAPPPCGSHAESRVLDAAIAPNVVVHEPSEVLAMVAMASSGGLKALLRVEPQAFPVTPGDVRSTGFDLEFPVDHDGHPKSVTVVLSLESRDFEPPALRKKVLVHPGADSTVCTFHVKPRHTGPLGLQLEVLREDVTLWSQRLRTSAVDGEAGPDRTFRVTRLPLNTAGHAAPRSMSAMEAPTWGQPPPLVTPVSPPGDAFGPPPGPPPPGPPPALAPSFPGAPPPGPPPPGAPAPPPAASDDDELPIGRRAWFDNLELPPAAGTGPDAEPPKLPLPPPPPYYYAPPGFGPPAAQPPPYASPFGAMPPGPLPMGDPNRGTKPESEVLPMAPSGSISSESGGQVEPPIRMGPLGKPRLGSFSDGTGDGGLAASSEKGAIVAYLVSIVDGIQSVSFPVYEGRSTVGRAETEEHTDVVLSHPTVSLRHAFIDCRDGKLTVTDRGSLNGVFVNDERLVPNQPRQLENQDEIRFGSVAVIVSMVLGR